LKEKQRNSLNQARSAHALFLEASPKALKPDSYKMVRLGFLMLLGVEILIATPGRLLDFLN